MAIAYARQVHDRGVHGPIPPLIGETFRHIAVAAVARRLGPALAVLHHDVLWWHRQSLHQRVNAALEHLGQSYETIQRRRELAILEFGEPTDREVGTRHDLFEGESASQSSSPNASAKVGKIDGDGHAMRVAVKAFSEGVCPTGETLARGGCLWGMAAWRPKGTAVNPQAPGRR